MSMTVRRAMLLSFVAAAVGVGLLGAAWACTGQPQVFSVTPLGATAGSEVTMRGGLVAPGRELELRWNGVAGPTLADTTVDEDARFAMSFAIPDDAEPGVYAVVAVSDDRGVGVGRSAVEVVADPGEESAATADGFAAGEEAAGLAAAEQTGTSPMLAAGVAMLSLGAVGLLAGFGWATARRQRAVAGVRRR